MAITLNYKSNVVWICSEFMEWQKTSEQQFDNYLSYDPVNAKLYWVQKYKERPVIHVYSVGEGEPVPFCGDGECHPPGEDVCNCPVDCGSPPAEDCTDGIDNDCDGLVDCDDEGCVAEDVCAPQVDCVVLKAACQQFLDECCIVE